MSFLNHREIIRAVELGRMHLQFIHKTSPAPAVNTGPLQVTLPDGSSKTIATGESAVVWLSGGSIGSRYDITLTATSGARVIQRTFQVRVVE